MAGVQFKMAAKENGAAATLGKYRVAATINFLHDVDVGLLWGPGPEADAGLVVVLQYKGLQLNQGQNKPKLSLRK